MAQAAPGGTRVRNPERWVLWDGVFSRIMDAWTGGVVLAGLAVFLGASNAELGIIAAIPFLAQVFQVAAVHLLGRITDKRRLVVACSVAARLLFALLAGLVLGRHLTSPILVLVLILNGTLTVIATAAWNAWMRDILDPGRLGRFFAKRMQVATAAASLALLGAGAFLDWSAARGAPGTGYTVVLLAGTAAGIVGTLVLRGTPQLLEPPRPNRPHALAQMRDCLAAPGGFSIVLGLGLAALALSLALPFSAVYLIRGAGYPIVAVTSLAMLSQVAYIAGLRIWGRVSDTHGNRGVMQVAIALLAFVLLAWSLQWQAGAGFTALLVLIHVGSGVAVGGLELTTGNLLLKMAPRDRVPSFLAAFTVARAGIAGIATVAAGFLWQWMGTGELASTSVGSLRLSLRGFHVLTLLSAVAALLAFRYLGRIPEADAGPVPAVFRAVRREVQVLSSVGGLRGFTHAVSHVVEAVRPRRGEDPDPPAPGATAKNP